jgi:hypothetical protein
MDIIRNLMSEGVGPDILIKRGATPKYVNMVCQGLVEINRKAKDGPSRTGSRERVDTILTPELETSALPPAPPSPSLIRSPSLGAVELARGLSATSINSVETLVKVERMMSPEQPVRLIPTSSWAPAPIRPPVRVESYRPQPSAGPSGTTNQSGQSAGPSHSVPRSNTPLGPRLGPGGIPRPSVTKKNSMRDRASDLSPVVKRPEFRVNNGQPAAAGSSTASPTTAQVESQGPQPHVAPTPVAHGAHNVLVSLTNGETASTAATPRPISAPSSVTVLPIASTSSTAAYKASNALLESKRRVLESLKRTRKPSEDAPRSAARPLTPPLESRCSPVPSVPAAIPSIPPLTQENMEDQVAVLMQEVKGLRAAEPIIVDDQEEGEIPDDVTPPVQHRMAPIIPATTPIQLNKSTKRRTAEDMMDSNQSQSVSPRSVYPAKRRLFGTALRMKRLIVHLDESDDEDEEAERQRELRKKEEDMMALREQIRILKERKAKARMLDIQAASQAVDEVPIAVVDDIVMTDSGAVNRPEIPALASVTTIDEVVPENQGVPSGK